MAFVQELNTLFAPENEALPPYYVQTLLEPDDPRFQTIEHGFEHKTSARVFRRLKLRRRLFSSHPTSLGNLLGEMKSLPARRSLLALTAVFLFFMIVTVAFTSTSFASGLEILLQGARSGVYQVNKYPDKVNHPTNNALYQPKEISLELAQASLMHFPIYWPVSLPANYAFTGIYLYQPQDQSRVDGPIVELEYDNFSPDVVSNGTGQIIIREFKPIEDVFQLVQSGSAYPLQVDQTGRARAIYIDGQWLPHGRFAHQWVTGGLNELIYQQNGVVFMIVGDQHDGINKGVLMQIAQSLQVVNFNRSMHMVDDVNNMVELVSNLPGPNNVLVFFPTDGTDTPYMTTIGTDQPLPEKAARTASYTHKHM